MQRYYDRDSGLGVTSLIADATPPVFGLVGSPLGLTGASIASGQSAEHRPTGLNTRYEQAAGTGAVHVISPADDTAPPSEPGRPDAGLRRQMEIATLLANLVLSPTQEAFMRSTPRSVETARGWRGVRWKVSPPRAELFELETPFGVCRLGLVGLDNADAATVLTAVDRIDERPDLIERLHDEVRASFRRRRGTP